MGLVDLRSARCGTHAGSRCHCWLLRMLLCGGTAAAAAVAAEPPLHAGVQLFSPAFGSSMVLQRAPARAAVYGTVNGTAGAVTVEVTGAANVKYSVAATITGQSWKALLRPEAAGGSYTITATMGAATSTLTDVTFGDVWYCSGQSNMALPLVHTVSRNDSIAAIASGRYSNIRLYGLQGNMNADQPWATLKDAIAAGTFERYSSTCYYYGESLTDELGGTAAPPIGLIHTAWGGSTIEQWLDNQTISTCSNATLSPQNQEYHENRVLPWMDMTIKGWVWCKHDHRFKVSCRRHACSRAPAWHQ